MVPKFICFPGPFVFLFTFLHLWKDEKTSLRTIWQEKTKQVWFTSRSRLAPVLQTHFYTSMFSHRYLVWSLKKSWLSYHMRLCMILISFCVLLLRSNVILHVIDKNPARNSIRMWWKMCLGDKIKYESINPFPKFFEWKLHQCLFSFIEIKKKQIDSCRTVPHRRVIALEYIRTGCSKMYKFQA